MMQPPACMLPGLLGVLLLAATGANASGTVHIVAAENVYADVAAQIAGPGVAVTAILSNPQQDPHLFEATPSVARALADAAITIANGAGYDPWMGRLLGAAAAAAAARSSSRQDLVVASLLDLQPGANPHLWYDTHTMQRLAVALTAALDAVDPAGQGGYDRRRDRFVASLGVIDSRIAALRRRFGGTPVTATEPVFGLMANALGLVTRNARLQVAVMNGAEPRISDVAAMEDDLRARRVAVLFYNTQATSSATQRLLQIARRANLPTVGVGETKPAGQDYQHWMLAELDRVERALSAPSR